MAKLFSAAISLFESPDTPELAAVPAVPAAAALATSSDATPEPLRVLEWGGGLDQSYFVESLDCEVGAARPPQGYRASRTLTVVQRVLQLSTGPTHSMALVGTARSRLLCARSGGGAHGW